MGDINNYFSIVNSIKQSYTNSDTNSDIFIPITTGDFVPYEWTEEDIERFKQAIKTIKQIKELREEKEE